MKDQEIVEQQDGSLERMNSEPSAQHYSPLTHREELTFPRGHRETGTDPRPGSLASLSLPRSLPIKTTLGIEWVKLDVLRFERFSRFIPLLPSYPKILVGFL